MFLKCPRCQSNKIRKAYRPTPLWRKLILRRNLICNKCNWEFIGFVIPGTLPKTGRKQKNPERND